jgi:hypothetical protein
MNHANIRKEPQPTALQFCFVFNRSIEFASDQAAFTADFVLCAMYIMVSWY